MSNTEKYITIQEGVYQGVSYKINYVGFAPDDTGSTIMKFDYEVKGLQDDNSDDFEQYLGRLITEYFEELIENDEGK